MVLQELSEPLAVRGQLQAARHAQAQALEGLVRGEEDCESLRIAQFQGEIWDNMASHEPQRPFLVCSGQVLVAQTQCRGTNSLLGSA